MLWFRTMALATVVTIGSRSLRINLGSDWTPSSFPWCLAAPLVSLQLNVTKLHLGSRAPPATEWAGWICHSGLESRHGLYALHSWSWAVHWPMARIREEAARPGDCISGESFNKSSGQN